MEITKIYTRGYKPSTKKYFMRVETNLFSIIEINKEAYDQLRLMALSKKWKFELCRGKNELFKHN